jgi:cobalt-zinc-cadmium efflux system outer membrane protein
MQSRHLVLGAAVLLAQLIPFSTQAAGQQSAAFTIGEVAPAANTNSAPLTLEQAIAMTLSTSPELRSAAQSVAIAEGARVKPACAPILNWRCCAKVLPRAAIVLIPTN